MDKRFATKDLEALYTEEKGAERYPPEVVSAFFKCMAVIDGAPDERDFRRLKSLHLEKLKGSSDTYSMRLNKQWRLELTFEQSGDGKIVVILRISKHYGD